MSRLDDILSQDMFGAFKPSEDEQEYLDICREHIKALFLEIIKEEQKNWDDKDDQTMWGYQALDRLSEGVQDL